MWCSTRTSSYAVIAALALLLPLSAAAAMDFPGRSPGLATGSNKNGILQLENAVVRASWDSTDGRLAPGELVDRLSSRKISPTGELFTILLADGREIRSSTMKLLGKADVFALPSPADPATGAVRTAGRMIPCLFVDEASGLKVLWSASLFDNDNYIHEEIRLSAEKKDVPLKAITLGEFSASAGAKVAGSVRGSPVVADNFFLSCEHPLAANTVKDGNVRCELPWNAAIKQGKSFLVSTIIGVAPKGQMRRAFLYYVERERARPYKPFLHYNSWFDIAWATRKMNEAECLTVIDLFGKELTEKRGVRLDSFVFDDGWDDPKTLWGFNAGFPNGFKRLKTDAEKYRSNIGVWVSPWGGYDKAKTDRLQYGRTQGFETNSRGFALAGPKYYARFREVCRKMIEQYGVNYFKFDGVGGGNNSTGELDPDSLADITALLQLTRELREMRPDLYVNMTVGTWPSPYWLWCGDSIWRGGDDTGFCGEGNLRQRWMNYRDLNVQRLVVRRGPLFPLNSLMSHGLAFARYGNPGKMNSDAKDIIDEMRVFFAGGSQLQELYVTPQKMTPDVWDALAEVASWSRANADVLVDTHWIGGDVGKKEPYGYASWSPRKGVLVVRNPNVKPQTLTLKLAEAFELPEGASRNFLLKSPWKADAGQSATPVGADGKYRVDLQPFEVRVLEATPYAAR